MYAGRRALAELPQLAAQAERQAQILTRAQLASYGVDHRAVARQGDAGRWALIGPLLVVLHRGPLDAIARRWAAVLNAGPSAGLCSWSALCQWGLRGWERDETHVVVPRGERPWPLSWVRIHESRRHCISDLVVPSARPPAHDVHRAAIDAAAWAPSSRTAAGLLAATVQQGLTSVDALSAALDTAGHVRHRKIIRATLLDIAGGADALSEIDLASLCLNFGLPLPTRQAMRTDIRGRRRYRDAEWVRWDGRLVVCEVDGQGHLEARRWYDDLMRDAELATQEADAIRIRLPAAALRTEPRRVEAVLRSVLLPQSEPGVQDRDSRSDMGVGGGA
jgi:hypothetical protein